MSNYNVPTLHKNNDDVEESKKKLSSMITTFPVIKSTQKRLVTFTCSREKKASLEYGKLVESVTYFAATTAIELLYVSH